RGGWGAGGRWWQGAGSWRGRDRGGGWRRPRPGAGGTPVRARGPTTDVAGRATIAVFPGDGIGPEVTAEAVAVLEAVAPRHGLVLELSTGTIGGAAIDAAGDPLPPAELERARRADAVLLGAVGGPRW